MEAGLSGQKGILYAGDIRPLFDEKTFWDFYKKMPEERRNKIDAFRFKEDRCRSLLAGILLEEALSERGIPERERKISLTEEGKPFLSEHPEIYFSLSHSGNMAMCLIADVPCGSDVEEIKADGKILKIADRFFTENERAYISGAAQFESRPAGAAQAEEECGPEEKDFPASDSPQAEDALNAETLRRFYRIWTRKESFLKATGRGMSLELTSFSVPLPEEEISFSSSNVKDSEKEDSFMASLQGGDFSFKSFGESMIFSGPKGDEACRFVQFPDMENYALACCFLGEGPFEISVRNEGTMLFC